MYSKKKEESKEKFDLQECFVLWRKVSDKKVEYFTGKDFNNNRIVAFNNEKKSEKQADIRIYSVKEDGTRDIEIASLWKVKFASGKEGLTGITNENEKLIAFYGDINKELRPYIRCYFRKENE